jgi:hypothetical protein
VDIDNPVGQELVRMAVDNYDTFKSFLPGVMLPLRLPVRDHGKNSNLPHLFHKDFLAVTPIRHTSFSGPDICSVFRS